MKKTLSSVVSGMLIMLTTATALAQPLKEAPLKDVKFADDGFWGAKLHTNRTVTVWHNIEQCEKTARLDNFDIAAGKREGKHRGIFFNDSDIYKVIEGASYVLASGADAKLDAKLDEWIARVAAAQMPDGYLYTKYQIEGIDKKFTNLKDMHELYCAGHLIEGAVAHHRATGKRNFLDVAIKWADLMVATFGPDRKRDVDGHEEVELALFKLADVTGNPKYAELAKFFLAERGHARGGRRLYGPYHQDHEPLAQCSAVTGHAVRQMYLLIAATDLALRGDATYVPAINRMWDDMTTGKLYVTGGVGARHEGEAFGEPFELPNDRAYAETCAGIGNAVWNAKLNLLTGDAKYFDRFEQALYNGILSGVSLSGDKFFYVNPLFSRGNHHRVPWFDCACCPPNVLRFLASLPSRAYATNGSAIFVNLYAAGDATLPVAGGSVKLTQETRYPWDGKVKLTVTPEPSSAEASRPFAIKLRIPSWTHGAAKIALNGEPVTDAKIDKGYATIERAWKAGDAIELDLPMEPRRVKSDPRVKANVGRVALQRGPIVYCAEGIDNGGSVTNLYLPPDASGKGGAMAVWLAEDPAVATIPPAPTIASRAKASASHVGGNGNLGALNDLEQPTDSRTGPHLAFWPREGTAEWIQYDFAEPTTIGATEIYWFDDVLEGGGGGGCKTPASWRVLYRDGGEWKPVETSDPYKTDKNTFNRVTFKPVKTDALRVEVQLQPDWSAGVMEWRVEPAAK